MGNSTVSDFPETLSSKTFLYHSHRFQSSGSFRWMESTQIFLPRTSVPFYFPPKIPEILAWMVHISAKQFSNFLETFCPRKFPCHLFPGWLDCERSPFAWKIGEKWIFRQMEQCKISVNKMRRDECVPFESIWKPFSEKDCFISFLSSVGKERKWKW